MKYLLKFILLFIVLFCLWVCDKVIYAALVIWHFKLDVRWRDYSGDKGQPITIKEAWKEIIHLTKKDWK